VAILKTIGVLAVIVLVLYVLFTVIGFLAATFFTLIEILVLVFIGAVLYYYFKSKGRQAR
jgi:uncharacterized membrane protein YkvI